MPRSRRSPELSVLSGSGDFYDAGPITKRLGKSWWVGGLYWSMTLYLGHPPVFGSNFVMRRDVWAQIAAEVHREATDIHDDLDLSLHIKPGMTVRYDPDFTVGISARPFATWSGFTRRLSWIVPTLRNHWPEDSPWARRAARRRYQQAQEAEKEALRRLSYRRRSNIAIMSRESWRGAVSHGLCPVG